ncbi:MAG: Acriflavin resistance protein [Marinimicrobia bacterium 46_47]|nr:MAG: Acriflavin resistance protein [Marinimicrobia bacterium 46_47]
MIKSIIKFFLENKLITALLLVLLIGWGVITSPFPWDTGFLPRNSVPVDAIPDIGENQQIVYTEWPGNSPRDIEDQITYPLTTALLGIPGVKTIRGSSMFGLSTIYLIFEEDMDFYQSRTRILEKLNSLPADLLPGDVSPALGPDATALGQIYWYTLEGRNEKGEPTGGWDPQELRSIQDFYVKYALSSVKGVSEVASVGGFVKEYQVDIDPNAMKAYGVNAAQIIRAVKNSNRDAGAGTLEFNRAEYLIRSLGYIKSLEDLENSVITVRDNVPVRIKDVSRVQFGPASRRGGLDKSGVEAVGGVVVAGYEANPLEVITGVTERIGEISNGLPSKTLEDGTVSKVTIVPFYDRTGLIHETLGTLEEALTLEIIISIIVVLILVMNLRASILISGLLPVGVLATFIFMRTFNVDANVVALSGIAIAIGVMVDVGIVFSENIIRHVTELEDSNPSGKTLKTTIYNATVEVAPAVITAITTTVISFLPVFTMEAAEGKLFKPLAFTKTFAMISAILLGLMLLPSLAYMIFSLRIQRKAVRKVLNILLGLAGLGLILLGHTLTGIALILYSINTMYSEKWKKSWKKVPSFINVGLLLFVLIRFLSSMWVPLGAQNSTTVNFLFVASILLFVIGILGSVIIFYQQILAWALQHKAAFLSLPLLVILWGSLSWFGAGSILPFIPESGLGNRIRAVFPGLGREFMPALDEGSFLLMPTTMPHSGVEENVDIIRFIDRRVNAIPEVDMVVGKWGRVNSALDPAPISMFENVINYKSEFILDEKGHRRRFKINREGAYILADGTTYHPGQDPYREMDKNMLIPDPKGKYFRQWRDHIHSPDDIWDEIIKVTAFPGLTSAPKLQPIQTRLVMLQTGMRAPMGIKVFGPDLESIEEAGRNLELHLQHVEGVKATSVFADRVVGKPYLEIHPDRSALARYGIQMMDFQSAVSSLIGGIPQTNTVEGRERYPVRVRYAREFRDNPAALEDILIPASSGISIPLGELASVEYIRGPQMIKSENTFPVSYVIFDKEDGYAEVDVVENARTYLEKMTKDGFLDIPEGVSYTFTGNYENQVRATRRLMMIIPLALVVIFIILYLQFRSVISTAMIFSGVLVAFSGGFIMLWLYSRSWFLNFSVAGMDLQTIFQISPINLSVAVWVGFLALFGIATDDGVLISTYLKQRFKENMPRTVEEVRILVMEAGSKRIRPAMMTTATSLIALLPILTSTGKGSDIMGPMAVPIFGGMLIAILTVFIVPVLFSLWQELKVTKSHSTDKGGLS